MEVAETKLILTVSTDGPVQRVIARQRLPVNIPVSIQLWSQQQQQYTDRVLHAGTGKWLYYMQAPDSAEAIMRSALMDSSLGIALEVKRIKEAYDLQIEAYTPVWAAHRLHIKASCKVALLTVDIFKKYAEEYGVLDTNLPMVIQLNIDREFILTFEEKFVPTDGSSTDHIWGAAPHCLLFIIYRVMTATEEILFAINEYSGQDL
jgi:hypothetical protein